MTGTIFLGGTARRKSSGARSRFARAWTNTRCNNFDGQAWCPDSQKLGGLGAGVRGLGAAPKPLVFRRKSPGGRQAKRETAQTAAAEVGAWREAGTGYPPYPRVGL